MPSAPVPGMVASSLVIVGSLPEHVSEQRLISIFSSTGNVKNAKIVPMKKGVAMVEFFLPQDAAAAVERFRKEKIDGHAISVSLA